MNCFNHPNRPAVGQCNNCGKFLCEECAASTNPILCDDCVSEIVCYQEKSERRLFIIAVVLFVLSFVGTIMEITVAKMNYGNIPLSSSLYLLFAVSFMWAGVPYGWVKLNKLSETLNVVLILPVIGWIIYIGIKLWISMMIGWFWFVQAIIKKFKHS